MKRAAKLLSNFSGSLEASRRKKNFFFSLNPSPIYMTWTFITLLPSFFFPCSNSPSPPTVFNHSVHHTQHPGRRKSQDADAYRAGGGDKPGKRKRKRFSWNQQHLWFEAYEEASPDFPIFLGSGRMPAAEKKAQALRGDVIDWEPTDNSVSYRDGITEEV